MEGSPGQEPDLNILNMEEKLNKMFSPVEPLLMKIQSLLVWEKPRRSFVMILCIHGLFWFLATTSMRVYFLVSMTAIFMFFIDTWKNKIWPEIRVPPPSPGDTDDWTPLHLRLLSVPEICRHLAELYLSASKTCENWIALRKDRPLPFCLMNCGIFSLLATIGHYIPGIMLTYILVISLLLWPCMVYHNVLQKIYLQGEPLFMRLDYSMKFRGRWPFKTKKVHKGPTADPMSESGESHAEVDTDSDLDEFVPSADPETTAALARAITDSEDEGGTLFPTPILSKEPSINDEDTLMEKEVEREFAHGLNEMPSFDDVLDQTDDEVDHLPLVTKPETKEKILRSSRSRETTPEDGRAGTMNFVPSHFREYDSDDETSLMRDLSFPDIADVMASDSQNSNFGIPSSSSSADALTASLMQQPVTTAMLSAALSGLSQFGESIRGATAALTPPTRSPALTPTDPRARVMFYAPDDDDERGEVEFASARAATIQEEYKNSDSDYSDDTEEADDFEFLDETELENYEKHNK